jgi:CheY-like chemotaxis protein
LNFTALVVEDDMLQRETLADLLKDEGLEVIECTTAEAVELVVASTGAELKALVTERILGGRDVRDRSRAVCEAPVSRQINVVMVSGRPPPYIPRNASFLLKPTDQRAPGSGSAIGPQENV